MTTTINASTSAGLVQTADTSGALALQTANTTAVSINASQVVTLTNALPVTSGGTGVTTSTGTGAVVLGTSPTIATPTMTGQATIPTINLTGGQITFPATQSASSDANTLDDYEEGTWTPTLTATTTNPTITSTNVSGRYIKIGSSVIIFCSANWGFTGGSGSVQIGGIPFACSSSATLAVGSLEAGNVTMGGSYTWGGVLLGSSDTAVSLRKYSNAGSGETAITVANLTSGGWLRFTLTYQSA